MSTIIADGMGTGHKAHVDYHGRLYVRTNHVSHLAHHSSSHKNSFMTHFDVTLPSTSETPVVLLYNSNMNNDLEVFDVWISANAAVEVNFYLDSAYASGGEIQIPLNMHLGSGIAPIITVYQGGTTGNLVVNTANEQYYGGAFMGGYMPELFGADGALIIPGNKGFVIKAIGTIGTRIKGMVSHSSHTTGTEL